MSTKAPQYCGSDDFVACLKRHTRAPVSIVEALANEFTGTVDQRALEDFVAWRRNPRISSLVELASAVSSEDLDQLLFAAEDRYSEMMRKA